LGSFVALRFNKPHFLSSFELLKAVVCHAITMKVDFTAIAASNESVICLGMKFRDYPMGRDFMLLHLTSPFVDDILKLPPRRLEGITDSYVSVLMSSGASGFPAYDDVGSIGNHEMNPDAKDVTLVMAVLGAANHHPAAYYPTKKLLKLGSFLPDTRLYNIGMLNAFERDLKGDLHHKPHLAATVARTIPGFP
jgi:hypothetical protein